MVRLESRRRSIIIFLILIYPLFMCSYPVLAWSNQTFNNSLSTETLEFTGSSDITRYLQVKNGVTVNVGFMNLTNASYINATCLQEFTNISSGCHDFNTGNYVLTGTCSATKPIVNAIDGNYSTFSTTSSGGNCNFTANYTKPTGAGNNSLWRLKYSQASDCNFVIKDYYIPPSCWNYDANVLALQVALESTTTQEFFCKNATAWFNVSTISGGCGASDFWDEAMIWNVSIGGTTNTNLSIGTTIAWNYSGVLVTNELTNNLSDYLNSYLSTCSFIGGFCYVPFKFHSDGTGFLTYSALNFSGLEASYSEVSRTYNVTTNGSTTEGYSINITYDSTSSFVANFVYDNIVYTPTQIGTGDNIVLTNSFAVSKASNPNVRHTFYWNLTINGTNSATSASTQVVVCQDCISGYTRISYWNFDDSNGAAATKPYDLWRHNTSITFDTGSTVLNTKQKFRNSLFMANTTGSLDYNDNQGLYNFTNNFTIMAWTFLNMSPDSGLDNIIVTRETTGGNINYKIYMDETSLMFYALLMPTGSVYNEILYNFNRTNEWQHIAITFNSSNYFKLYINGTLYNGSQFTNRLKSDDGLFLFVGTNTAGERFNGTLDEVKIFTGELNSSDIQHEMELEKIVLEAPAAGISNMSTANIISSCTMNGTIANWTSTLKNLSLWNNFNSIWSIKNYTTITGSVNSSTKQLTYKLLGGTAGNVLWTCQACYSDDSCIWAYEGNRTFNIIAFLENFQTYTPQTYETQVENFLINFTYDSNYYDSILASLVYNGTEYAGTRTGTGNNIFFSKLLNIEPIPAVARQNKSFYWKIGCTNATGTTYFNSTWKNQSIDAISFSRCNATFTTLAVNYTVLNESTLGILNATMEGTFKYSANESGLQKIYNLARTESNTAFQFCILPNITYFVDSTLLLTSEGLPDKTFSFINDIFTNTPTQKSLLMTISGTNVIIKVLDSDLTPLVNYTVEIYRYYPATDSYNLTSSRITDMYGQFVENLIENTVKYKFIIKDGTGTVKKTVELMYIACKASICVIEIIVEDTTDDYSRFKNVTDFDYELYFVNSTKTFTFTWTDITGKLDTIRLQVDRFLMNGSRTVCNNISTLTSGSITCYVGDSSASYSASAYRKGVGDAEIRVALLQDIRIGSNFGLFGKEGLFWALILLMTVLAMGYWHPVVGAVSFCLGFTMLGVMNILYVNWGIYIAVWAISIAFIWAFSRR